MHIKYIEIKDEISLILQEGEENLAKVKRKGQKEDKVEEKDSPK